MMVRSMPVSTFFAVTWTRGTTAPVGSAMRPSRVPVTVCAVAADQSRLRAAIERIDFTLTSRNRRIIHAVDRNGRRTADADREVGADLNTVGTRFQPFALGRPPKSASLNPPSTWPNRIQVDIRRPYVRAKGLASY